MSGETQEQVSGWTVDTLRAHLLARLDDQRDALRREIADQHDFTRTQIADLRASSLMTTSDLRLSVRQQADDQKAMLNERYETQTKALDAAFKAAEQAVAVALANAAQATQKAEAAADKRFESVNEFRQSLADQTRLFLTRTEYDSAHTSVLERVNQLSERMAVLPTRPENDIRLEGLKGTDAQQEERIRDLETRTAGLDATRENRSAGRQDDQRQSANRLVAIGVTVSVLLLIANVIIAVVLHG
jgi:hypothetical protein